MYTLFIMENSNKDGNYNIKLNKKVSNEEVVLLLMRLLSVNKLNTLLKRTSTVDAYAMFNL